MHLRAAVERGQQVSPVSGQWSRPGTGHTATAPNLSAPNMEMLSKIYSLLHISHCQQQKHELCSNFFVSHVSACLVSRRVTRPAVPCLARTRSRWCGRCWSCTCRGWRGSSRGSCRRSTLAPQHHHISWTRVSCPLRPHLPRDELLAQLQDLLHSVGPHQLPQPRRREPGHHHHHESVDK